MNKKKSQVLISAGIGIFLLGLTAFLMEGNPLRADYDVKGGATLELSWYNRKDDRTEGMFTVSGGNEEVKFYLKDPTGIIIHDPGIVKNRYDYGFTAENSGIYSFYFENLESLSDKTIHARWLSPYEGFRLTFFDTIGLLMMLGGVAILVYGADIIMAGRKKNMQNTNVESEHK